MNKKVTIYAADRRPSEPIHYVQGSTEIPIEFYLADYPIPESAEARIYIKKPSGLEIYNSCLISGNSAIMQPTAQTFAEAGVQFGHLQITTANSVLVSFPLRFEVEKNQITDSAIESSNEYGALDAMIFEARAAIEATNTAAENANDATAAALAAIEGFKSTLDSTLTVEGAAADAAAVGAALAGKAPAGYGLGEGVGRYCADCDAITAGGFYYADSNTANMPTNVSGGAILAQTIQAPDGIDIYLTLHNGAVIIKRYYSSYAKAWQPWEFANPPMQLGVEYRTTERHMDKPVYTKLIDFGALPNTTEKAVNVGVSGAASVIRYEGVTEGNDGTTFCDLSLLGAVTTSFANIVSGDISITLATDRDATALTARIKVRYTKN